MEGFPAHELLPPEPEGNDPETLRGVLSDIDSIALELELGIVLRGAVPPESLPQEELSGAELDASIADLSANTVKDIREFERREGVKEGLQLVANRALERLERHL